MLFSSPAFFLFFAIYFIFHVATPKKYRIALIIVGSSVFYGYWNPFYLWLPYSATFLAYFGVHWMQQAEGDARTRRLAVLITLFLIPLAFFKYTNFLYGLGLRLLGHAPEKLIHYALPLGISFVTFTLIAYVVDVYRGKFKEERTIPKLMGSVLFFPHLIAGPIVRPSQLIPQLGRLKDALRVNFTYGVALFTLGLFKKLIFADQVAAIVDKTYGALGAASLWDLWFAFYGFALQIYCDFSGYTDMALGLAVILGIRLPNNFHHPYTSESVIEFWKRWHITLSTWLRDYLYIPLGGNRAGRAKQMRNLLITMILGGLWHGANLTFVVWGLLHGLALVILHSLKSAGRMVRVPKALAVFITFNFVTLAWVFFRAPTTRVALGFIKGLFTAPATAVGPFLEQNAFVLALLVVFGLTHWLDSHSRVRLAIYRLPRAALWAVIVVAWVLAITVSSGSSAQFIYFEF